MSDLLRDAPFGQLVRFFTGNRVFQYPEEKADFRCPNSYKIDGLSHHPNPDNINEKEETKEAKDTADESRPPLAASAPVPDKLSDSSSNDTDLERQATLGIHRTNTLPYSNERLEIEQKMELEKSMSKPVVPVVTSDGTILADWYSTDDPMNPQNWSQKKKAFVALQIK